MRLNKISSYICFRLLCVGGMISFTMISGCNKLNQFPKSSLSPETFFRTKNELETYTNQFYSQIVPSATDIYYSATNNADDQATVNISDAVQGIRIVPTTGGGWSWTNLRRINFYLIHSHQCKDKKARLHYDGIARFFRAWFYYKKIRRFGDVPWYSKPIGSTEDNKLKKPRDSRAIVIDSILADLDFAIENLPSEKNTYQITKWTALALKSRICLFEGTFREYHQNDNFGKDSKGEPLGDGKELLKKCVSASEELMKNSGYSIYKEGGPYQSYYDLFTSDDAISQEIILAKAFNDNLSVRYKANFRTVTPSFGRPGVTKRFVNSYLMKNGSRFTDISGYKTMGFYDESQNRDPRMTQTVRTPGYIGKRPATSVVPDLQSCLTGYQWIKYITSEDPNEENTNDLPVFRYAEVLLNFAEAKAELGILTQNDLNISIKLIRDRVNMPNIDLINANSNPDPYLSGQYKHVTGTNKGVILEIRRERRIELAREGFRYWDLMRWDEGHLLTVPFKGIYFPGTGNYDLDRDGTVDLVLYTGDTPTPPSSHTQMYALDKSQLVLEDGNSGGNIIAQPKLQKEFDEGKDYLYPIPIQERLLNPNLTQNPEWEDGIH